MKTFIKTFALLLLVGLVYSCNNMDEKVFSSVTEQTYNYTEKDFDPIVSSIYRYMRDLISHQNYYMAQESSTDAIVMPPNASGWDDGGLYRRMHYHTWNSEQVHVRGTWSALYQGILICNNVLTQLATDKVLAPTPTEKEAALAEVRATRAFYYWLVCDNFGDAPLVTQPSNELPEKVDRKTIYDYILNELNEVIPQLSEEVGGKMYGRMNKWAAKTLLANIFLNAKVYTGEAKWADCLVQCNEIIASGKLSLSPNYLDPFRTNGVENNNEIIFSIPFDQELAGGNSIHMFSWHGELKKKYQTESTPWGSGSAMGISQFIDTYDSEDERLANTWLMGNQYSATGELLVGTYDMKGEPLCFTKDLPDANYTKECEGFRMNKFEIVKECQSSSSTDFPLFRYAQVLLMKAECLLRTGGLGAAELVTQVRQRNFKANPAKAQVSEAQLKANSKYKYGFVENYKITEPGDQSNIELGGLYDELGWEFAWEAFRRRDMIRFGTYTTKSWLSHKPQGDFRAVFPIPFSVLTSNPKLIQNPNYE